MAKEYIEKKLHELETGEFRAEPLNEVLSRDEIDPEVLVPQGDSKGTVVLKKASSKGAMPSGPEQLRLRLTIMQNALLMIGLHHPGRAEIKDIDFQLFERYKDYLLGEFCYGLRTNEASGSLVPPWTLVLSYEHAIRKQCYKADDPQGDRLRGCTGGPGKTRLLRRGSSPPLSRYATSDRSPGYRISRIRVEARASRMARLTTATRSKSSTRRQRVAILAPRITSLSVFVSMLKAAVRKGLSATSCTCARSAVETTRLWRARRLRRQRLTAATTDLRLHVGGYKHCVSFQAGIGLPLSRATCANWLRPSTAISAPRWRIRWWIGS